MELSKDFVSNWCVVPSVRSMNETVYGVRTHYVSAGSGEPLILIHGGGPGASGEAGWSKVIPALAKQFQVFAIDLIGSGYTDKPIIEYSMQTLVEHVAGFVDALKLDKIRICGNSQGAYVAAKYMLDNPGRVDSAVLISTGTLATACGIDRQSKGVPLPPFTGSKESLRNFMEVIVNNKSAVTSELIEARYRVASLPGHKEMLDSLTRYRKRCLEDSNQNQVFSVRERLVKNTIPLCFIWGEDDKSAPFDPLGTGLQALLPGVPFHILENCGHQVQTEQPEAFLDLLLSHLAGN